MIDLFEWRIPLRAIGPNGVTGSHTASLAECKELARVVDILACESLKVEYKIVPLRSGIYRLSGHILADLKQQCVVTLEPISEHIDEAINTELRPADMLPEGVQDIEEMGILETPDFEPIEDDMIDLGLIVLEHISTSINPYPRLPGVELDVSAAGDSAVANPFAALGKLKK
ncbi:MAG: DUF177 domain-containing protein [Hyphomicrobiaceae bacterium]|nr:DUF177 domain-containing protein [Hyphomicrobiaceae bacterium]